MQPLSLSLWRVTCTSVQVFLKRPASPRGGFVRPFKKYLFRPSGLANTIPSERKVSRNEEEHQSTKVRRICSDGHCDADYSGHRFDQSQFRGQRRNVGNYDRVE